MQRTDFNSQYLSRLVDAQPSLVDKLDDTELRARLLKLDVASDALSRLVIADAAAFDAVADLDARTEPPKDPQQIEGWYKRELLRIATRDVCELDSLTETAAALSQAADDVLHAALGDANDLAIVAMGKHGGNELNYSSDVDVMFVGDASPMAVRAVLDIARRCFRVDIALRPEGRNGALVRSMESYETYWQQWAAAWEFQALLKARAAVGPQHLLDAWTESCSKHLWSKSFGADDIASLRSMKIRTEAIADSEGEVKRGKGGIRDVEFAVQLLQLVHGTTDFSIRSKRTLTALQQLADGGYISSEDASALCDSYIFLREVEHRLQLVELAQTHTIPKNITERTRIARGLGMSVTTFDDEVVKHKTRVRHAHERLYFRPLLEHFANNEVLSPGSADERLRAFGFTETERTKLAIRELTSGLARSSRLMHQMMPVLLNWLSSSPDPDVGLLGLRHLMSGFRTPSQIVATFRDSPEVARRICLLLGTSNIFARNLIRDPELLNYISTDFRQVDFPTMLANAMDWRADRSERLTSLARFKELQSSRLSAFEALDQIDDQTSTRNRSDLADAVLARALDDIDTTGNVAIIAMGRYGGREIGAGSDLDIVITHDGVGPSAQQEAEAVASRLKRSVSHPSPAYRLYEIDYDLRPEGKQGVIARSVESCREYYSKWSSPWEKQALVRARFAAGNAATAERFFEVVDSFVWSQPPSGEEVREMRRLKARMETERIGRNEDPKFHLKLGPGSLSDVEWTVQLNQLQHGIQGASTLSSLERIVEQNLFDEGEVNILRDAWVFCQKTRNRLALVAGDAGNSLPAQHNSLSVLARSLGMTASEVREEYLRVTRRARPVVERRFYGAES